MWGSLGHLWERGGGGLPDDRVSDLEIKEDHLRTAASSSASHRATSSPSRHC